MTGYRICPLCESTCGLEFKVEGGFAVDVRGHENDLFSRGYLCPKGANLGALDADPDRLKTPLIRRDGELVQATWDEAFAEAARGFAAVREAHGSGALALYRGNPSAHSLAVTPYLRPLIKALGTKQIYSASTADQVPTQVACGLVYGSAAAIPVPDLDRTSHLLILGANPAESNGSLCTAPDFRGRLHAIRERGGTVTVVDPRRTRTARLADRHLPIRPTTDAYFLFALVHVIFEEDLENPGPHGDRLTGLADVRELAAVFAPEAVADVCGIAAADIRATARELAAAQGAAVYGRMGTCATSYGTVTNWLIQVLNLLTGNVDRPGGLLFPVSPTRAAYLREQPFRMGRWHSRVRELPEVFGEFPVATLADEIETPGEGRIRALLTIAGNPVVSAPNGVRIGELLPGLDFMVSIDPYVNETTRHADVILPPPRVLQSGHYDWALSSFFVRAVVRYSPPVVDLAPGQPGEDEILARLSLLLSGQDGDTSALSESLVTTVLGKSVKSAGSPVLGRDPAELRAQLNGSSPLERYFEAMLRLGPFGDGFGADPEGLTLQSLLDHPEGIDRGEMRPRLAEVLPEADGKIDLCPDAVRDEVASLAAGLRGDRTGFVLIGRRTLRSNNSWMHNVPNLVSGPQRCTLLVNETDADRLGVATGDRVRVASGKGAVTVDVETTLDIRPGVVSLPHGWGQRSSNGRLGVAARAEGVNANALTDESIVDVLSGNAVLNGVPVSLEPEVATR
ncbi:molybdopterin-dependent oxidoreductase [Amycolatopsis acidicola]|uniref:Molybdopterin-dependent oxidoreductase n=1 Tax=Amycolatopsis acidicola TaxID=2596893 RepID=A0A5N0UR95_9PSEU|nr:molybdopterin-dependent oxidoreductase [Amycolatopsis acidicola]KAA9153996.1 molybdopterin-dependent oxidoreductase [Amycolatopsis acidicola]